MALLKIWEVSRGIMRLLAIQFVCWLGWFSTFALAQFDISEGVTGSVNFPALGVTSVANLAVLVTSLIRGRLDLEMGARDVLDILLSPQLRKITAIQHGYGLITYSDGKFISNTTTGGGGGVDSSEGVLQAASTGENDVETAPTGEGRETASTASTEENVQSSRTEGGGLLTISREREVLEATDVIILSYGKPNWSMRQFIKSNAHVVRFIILQFLPLEQAIEDKKVEDELRGRDDTMLNCECQGRRCECIVFWTVENITSMLARRMPGTLKRLTDSLCLLPCSICLTNGCHGCNPESLEGRANEGQSVVSFPFGHFYADMWSEEKPFCISIPMRDARHDVWTKLLLRSLRSKDAEGRGVRNMATEALEGYLAGGSGSEAGIVEYDIFSFVVPRLTEVLINLVLTFWFRVDGFSSALVARRTVRDYLVDSTSSGFAANAFLTEAKVLSNDDNNHVWQVLTFRGRDWLCFITFMSGGFVNVICALAWALFITFEGGSDASQPPSLPRVAVIIAAICLPWVVSIVCMVAEGVLWNPFYSSSRMLSGRGDVEAFWLDFLRMTGRWFVKVFLLVLLILVFVISPVLGPGIQIVAQIAERRNQPYASPLIATGFVFEMACPVSLSALAGARGIKCFGRWIYGALQILIWVKWATGSYFLHEEKSSEFSGRIPHRIFLIFYSSAFWLNAVLAGVRCKWEAWPWRHNHLF